MFLLNGLVITSSTASLVMACTRTTTNNIPRTALMTRSCWIGFRCREAATSTNRVRVANTATGTTSHTTPKHNNIPNHNPTVGIEVLKSKSRGGLIKAHNIRQVVEHGWTHSTYGVEVRHSVKVSMFCSIFNESRSKNWSNSR